MAAIGADDDAPAANKDAIAAGFGSRLLYSGGTMGGTAGIVGVTVEEAGDGVAPDALLVFDERTIGDPMTFENNGNGRVEPPSDTFFAFSSFFFVRPGKNGTPDSSNEETEAIGAAVLSPSTLAFSCAWALSFSRCFFIFSSWRQSRVARSIRFAPSGTGIHFSTYTR